MKFFKLNSHLSRRGLLMVALGLLLLSFISSWYFSIQPSISSQQKKIQRYIQRQQKDVNDLLSDTILMRKLVVQSETLDELKEIRNKKYGLFLFAETISDNQDLIFWNTQKILPPKVDFGRGDGEYFQKLLNGFYVVEKKTLRFEGLTNNVVAYVLIPVVYEYYLENNELVTSFAHDDNAGKLVKVDTIRVTRYPVKSVGGKTLFHLQEIPHAKLSSQDVVTIFLRVLALIFILTFLHLFAESIVRRQRALYGIFALAISFILFRLILYQFPKLFSFRQFELFDPTVYAANVVHASLGDLLINSALFCWLILFAWYSIGPSRELPRFIKGRWIFVTGVACVFVLIFSTFQFANIVRSLVADSKISFNVTNFFSLDVFTVMGLIVLALLSLGYYYFTRILFRFIFSAFRDRYIYIYFVLAVVGLIYLTLQTGNPIVLFHLPVLLWVVIYTLLVSQEKFIINRFRITIAGALFWIFVFSVSLSVIIIKGNREKELINREDVAEKYEEKYDDSYDNTMNATMGFINNRYLVTNFNRFYDANVSRFLRDSIIRQNILGYKKRFDAQLYLFDSDHRAVNNDYTKTYNDLNTLFTAQGKSSGVPDLRIIEKNNFNRLTYITRRDIFDSVNGIFVGTFFVVSTPKNYNVTDMLTTQAFRQVSIKEEELSSIYLYALYKNDTLQEFSSKYPFKVKIAPWRVPSGSTKYVDNAGFSELWYKVNSRKVIVIAKKKDTFYESITLFSYLFCAFLFMVGILQIIAVLLRLLNERAKLNLLSGLNIRTQIHGTVIFISILSFLIIGAATISFFITRYNRNNIDRISRTADNIGRELKNDSTIFSPGLSDSVYTKSLRAVVSKASEIHNAAVNIYSVDGNMKVTSDDNVFREGLISTKMDPVAFYHLSQLNEVQFYQEEDISSLQYWSIYTAVRDRDNNVVGYLNIPYFPSQVELKQEISNFLVTIINLNAFIFLIAGIIALFITNTITKSFSVIGDKMKAITLGKTNEEIVWNKDDEIGVLVNQYNKMVKQLEESAEALARSEREGAWREMARQVAHEIKNPLTPMKLSIQYLQKATDANHSNIRELTTNVANTLIEQIDHLSKIAADFSQFANIGNKKIELVDLHQVIGILVDLYSSNPKLSITWNRIAGSIVMKADKTQMNRVFTNLLTNAVDACPGKDDCQITISEMQDDSIITISITDNGEGIPLDMQNKIFTPNFTTKSSGTGLGLAMCKSIIEQANGKIWFETEEGEGTTFFVQLPVIS